MSEERPESPWGTYERPVLERVELRPEEAVLAFCKGPGGQGPQVGACNTAGGPDRCYERGT